MKEIEKLFSVEEIFTRFEAENQEIKEMLSSAEHFEGLFKELCGDEAETYADLQTRLQFEMCRYSFFQGVKTGLRLKER